jgi:hypothetical protein
MGLNIKSPITHGGGKSLPHPPKGTGRAYKGVNINSLNKKNHKFFNYKRGGSPSRKVKGRGGDPSNKGGVKVNKGNPQQKRGLIKGGKKT